MTRGPGDRQPIRRGILRLALAGGGLLALTAALVAWMLRAGTSATGPAAPLVQAAQEVEPRLASAAAAADPDVEGGLTASLRRPVLPSPPWVHEGEPRRVPRAGTEAAELQDFLARATAPEADVLALGRAGLAAGQPLASRLAALRGLAELRPGGWAAALAEAALPVQDGTRGTAELGEAALLALQDLAAGSADARAALFDLLGATGSGPEVLAARRSAASALARTAPAGELAALAARLHAGEDPQLLAGVRAALSKNPAAGPLAASFPAAARPDPAGIPGADGGE